MCLRPSISDIMIGWKPEKMRWPPPAAVSITDRPMHCPRSEIYAQNLRQAYKGLRVTSLTKFYYLACCTPPFSPPTIARASPTHVLDASLKYMEGYQRERKLTDPIPSSWRLQNTPKPTVRIPVPMESLHLYDADSYEIYVGRGCLDRLKSLNTHGNYIRGRLPFVDAPESKFSVRIYKQSTATSTNMSRFLTRHIGIEATRVARAIVHEADEVLLSFATKEHDHYGRLLSDIFVVSEGNLESLAVLLATRGYVMSFYTSTRIHVGINELMRKAIAKGRRYVQSA